MTNPTSSAGAPRELTKDEVRENFLEHVRGIVDYWETVKLTDHALPDNVSERRWRLEGVAFSIMVLLDGGNVDIPGFTVSPNPHADDRGFNRARGENWYPGRACDIGGALHELLKFQEHRR